MFTGKISNDTDFCNDKYVSLWHLKVYTNLVAILFYRLQMISFVFYVYRPLTSKMPKALPVYWRISERELVLVRKYDNTPVSPRNEGFTWQRVFYWFSSKKTFATSDNKYYHSKYRMNLYLDQIYLLREINIKNEVNHL